MSLKYGMTIVSGSTLFSKASNHSSGTRPPSMLKPITKVLSLESEDNSSKTLVGEASDIMGDSMHTEGPTKDTHIPPKGVNFESCLILFLGN